MPVITYKCPNCDGELIFDPGEQRFCCEYCRSSFTEQELETKPPCSPLPQDTEQEAFDSHAVELVCPSCGAQVIAEDTTAATTCVYCHNPVVLSGRLSGKYKPDRVIPFQVEKGEVESQFQAWCKKKKFIKQDFCIQAKGESFAGVYLPFWIVNATVSGSLYARGRKMRSWRSGEIEYTEVKEYHLIREAEIDFWELPMEGIKGNQMELAQGLYPYDYSGAVDFSMAYLSGFQAEKRNLEQADLQEEERNLLKNYTQSLLKETISGYQEVVTSRMSAETLRESWQYMLLPVWLFTYQYRNKDYFFAMNGQTGKICGKVPLSIGRLAILFGIVFAVMFLILMLGEWLL